MKNNWLLNVLLVLAIVAVCVFLMAHIDVSVH